MNLGRKLDHERPMIPFRQVDIINRLVKQLLGSFPKGDECRGVKKPWEMALHCIKIMEASSDNVAIWSAQYDLIGILYCLARSSLGLYGDQEMVDRERLVQNETLRACDDMARENAFIAENWEGMLQECASRLVRVDRILRDYAE
ncbi:MAG TPA: hypothetical protein VMF06_11430 [Candidatus Limnocylindria bacterium]|nr:hypothetical protein [Candidatus Limnocylindria bacterium]